MLILVCLMVFYVLLGTRFLYSRDSGWLVNLFVAVGRDMCLTPVLDVVIMWPGYGGIIS